MKIGLVSALMRDNDCGHQLNEIKRHVSSNHNCDLLCFGESFIQGFEGLTWQYEEDINRAITQDDSIVLQIKEWAKQYNCGISFGFIEKENETIFSSNMVIDRDGNVIDVFRRVSTGWKEPIAGEFYQEGVGFHTFEYMGKVLSVAICGDFFNDGFLNELEQLEIDALLWPVYKDTPTEQWLESSQGEYTERAQNMPCPTLMINSFDDDNLRAKGGCYVFHHNKILSSLPFGNVGILEFELL